MMMMMITMVMVTMPIGRSEALPAGLATQKKVNVYIYVCQGSDNDDDDDGTDWLT